MKSHFLEPDEVPAFTLKRGVPKTEYDYNNKADRLFYEKKLGEYLMKGWRVKRVEESYRRVIVLIDAKGQDASYLVFKRTTSREEKDDAMKANRLCIKLIKSLDDGDYSNKALMDDILEHGVSKLHSYPTFEFNLPMMHTNQNVHEESDVESLDLNNAYAMCLYRNGLISMDMFQMLVNASKGVRLRVLGMLAKRQNIWDESHGGENDKWTISYKSKYHALFFYAQNEIAKMMSAIKQIFTDKYFIFFWVDGIYYKKSTPQRIKNEVIEWLSGAIRRTWNYDYKFEKVPYLKHYKEGNKYFLYLTKINKHNEPEPKMYSLSKAWLQEEAVEVL